MVNMFPYKNTDIISTYWYIKQNSVLSLFHPECLSLGLKCLWQAIVFHWLFLRGTGEEETQAVGVIYGGPWRGHPTSFMT